MAAARSGAFFSMQRRCAAAGVRGRRAPLSREMSSCCWLEAETQMHFTFPAAEMMTPITHNFAEEKEHEGHSNTKGSVLA